VDPWRPGDAAGKVHYWFLIEGTPLGGAPDDVRAQWDGVVVPVREPRPLEAPVPFATRQVVTRRLSVVADGVPVRGHDAVRALELFDRPARTWWRDHLAAIGRPQRLVFRVHEGRFLSPDTAVRLFPVLADFDT
jgi:hypothetical protein